MIRSLLPAMTAAAVLMLSGCGENSSTEPRLNFITMINAKDVNITAQLFTKKNVMEPRLSVDDTFEAVDEAPHVWYDDHVGEETISQGHLINGYVAADCTDDNGITHNHLYHSPSAGSLNIVNTMDQNFTIDLAGTNEFFGACAVREFDGASLSDQSSITVTVNGKNYTINLPTNGGVIDVVIFRDYTAQQYDIKAFKG